MAARADQRPPAAPISSRENPLFKRIRRAIREHADEIAIEGPKAVADALAAGWKPIAVIERGVHFTPALFDALADTSTPQGTIALFERPHADKTRILARHDTIAVALDGVQDPGNVGTIVRLAAAFDAAGVLLLPGCADPYGPKAIRSSAGAILSVATAEVSAAELMTAATPLFHADMHGATSDPPARAAILVFGSEGQGVSDEIRRASTPIAVPMCDRVESLNVASSAAILLARSFALRT